MFARTSWRNRIRRRSTLLRLTRRDNFNDRNFRDVDRQATVQLRAIVSKLETVALSVMDELPMRSRRMPVQSSGPKGLALGSAKRAGKVTAWLIRLMSPR